MFYFSKKWKNHPKVVLIGLLDGRAD